MNAFSKHLLNIEYFSCLRFTITYLKLLKTNDFKILECFIFYKDTKVCVPYITAAVGLWHHLLGNL